MLQRGSEVEVSVAPFASVEVESTIGMGIGKARLLAFGFMGGALQHWADTSSLRFAG